MKRVQSACLLETIHFQIKRDLGRNAAAESLREEMARYFRKLEKIYTRFQVTGKEHLSDGSVVLHIKKQFQSYE